MNNQLQDTILSFTQSTPRTIAEIADHLYLTMQKHADHRFIGNCMRHLSMNGLIKQCDKRKVAMAWANTYKAMTKHEQDAFHQRKERMATPSPSFLNDPMMAAFYSKQNI